MCMAFGTININHYVNFIFGLKFTDFQQHRGEASHLVLSLELNMMNLSAKNHQLAALSRSPSCAAASL